MAASGAEPTVILGAGYAGLGAWHAAHRASRGRWPVVIVDRHPVHVLRTELYKVGKLASRGGAVSEWVLPLYHVLRGAADAIEVGTVEAIDLEGRRVTVDGERMRFREIAIALGSVPAYYGVPGAAERCYDVYRLSDALMLAQAIRDRLARASGTDPALRVAVVGGGSTGTEVAAEIATTRWSRVVGHPTPAVAVQMVAGRLPFLAGFPPAVIRRARMLLGRARVLLDEGRNVASVEPRALTLEDGARVPFDLCVWAAGIRPPDLIRTLATPLSRAGRVVVDGHLELPGRPGVFALGDVAEAVDPVSGLAVPATAQAALAEAPVVGQNLAARRLGRPLKTFRYREKGVIVAVGIGEASGSIRGLSLWGAPASLIKSAVQRGHRFAAERGGTPPGL